MGAAKAVAAAVATVVMFVVFDQGDPEVVETAIATIVNGLLVYFVPNRTAP